MYWQKDLLLLLLLPVLPVLLLLVGMMAGWILPDCSVALKGVWYAGQDVGNEASTGCHWRPLCLPSCLCGNVSEYVHPCHGRSHRVIGFDTENPTYAAISLLHQHKRIWR